MELTAARHGRRSSRQEVNKTVRRRGEEHRGHGGMDGQKALGIELLSIQSMDAAVGRRWWPGEVGGLGLHGAAWTKWPASALARSRGGVAMAGPDESGQGRRLTTEGDERQRRSRA